MYGGIKKEKRKGARHKGMYIDKNYGSFETELIKDLDEEGIFGLIISQLNLRMNSSRVINNKHQILNNIVLNSEPGLLFT